MSDIRVVTIEVVMIVRIVTQLEIVWVVEIVIYQVENRRKRVVIRGKGVVRKMERAVNREIRAVSKEIRVMRREVDILRKAPRLLWIFTSQRI